MIGTRDLGFPGRLHGATRSPSDAVELRRPGGNIWVLHLFSEGSRSSSFAELPLGWNETAALPDAARYAPPALLKRPRNRRDRGVAPIGGPRHDEHGCRGADAQLHSLGYFVQVSPHRDALGHPDPLEGRVHTG
jgi:hypothetical protein